MANAKEIQERMSSINDTLKITNAMYMISSSKLKKSKKMLAGYRALLSMELQDTDEQNIKPCT